jgi:acyl-CoA dehydrogenase
MNFEYSVVQKELRALAQKFVQKELLPIVDDDEREERFRPELIAKLGELGLTGVPVPEIYGGSGLGYQEYVVALEELAGTHLCYAISVAVTGLTQVILNQFGNEEQKRKYIPALAQGKAIGAFSLSESFSGSDAASLRTVAKKEGDHYFITGTKLWTTQGDIADTLILMARTGGPGPKGISAFIVEKGTPGFSLGKREKKMGIRSSHTMELVFQEMKVPASALLSQEGEGFKIAMTALDSGRITIGAAALGLAQSALNVAIGHAKERVQFGKPISEFQGVSFMLADMATQLEAARLLVYQAAYLRDQNLPYTQEAAMAKLFSTDMAMKVTTDAVQILGGSGYTQDFPVERYMKEAKVLQIVEGTNQIQRMIIGRNLTQS